MIFFVVLFLALILVVIMAIIEDSKEARREAANREAHIAWVEEDNAKWRKRRGEADIVNEKGTKMRYCSHCGKEIMDETILCPHCGCAVEGKISFSNEPDEPSLGLNIVGLCFPIIGLILFLLYHDRTPRKAHAIGLFSLIGFVIGCISWFIILVTIYG